MSKLTKLKNAEGLISTKALAKELGRRHNDLCRSIDAFLPKIHNNCLKHNFDLSEYVVKEVDGEKHMTEKVALAIVSLVGNNDFSVETKLKYVDSMLNELNQKLVVIEALEGELVYLQDQVKTFSQKVVEDVEKIAEEVSETVEVIKEEIEEVVEHTVETTQETVKGFKKLSLQIKLFLTKIFG